MLAVILGIGSVSAPTPARADGFVVKDMRNKEPGAARFTAWNDTMNSQAIVLLGGNKAVWPKIRDAARQAQDMGCPVRAIVVGPADAPPSLEIYALNIHVTKPINPYDIDQGTLKRLICGIHKEYYVENRQHYLDIQNGTSSRP
jgi:hypothetical protein